MGWGFRNFVSAILVVCLAVPSLAEARRVRAKSFTAIDLGVLGTNMTERFSVKKENAKHTGSIAGYARFRLGLKLSNAFYFEPSFGAMVPWDSAADGKVWKFLFQGSADLGWQVLSFLKLRGGPGALWTLSWSRARTVTLNNGNGTSDFYTPAALSSSFTPTANLGLEILFSKSLSLNLDAHVLNPLRKQRRSLNGAVTLGIRL